jgi:3',5'-cyclic AMP phosphodiesterase CpdA
MCATAQAITVDYDYEVGSGSSFFQVALIADPHNDTLNLWAAVHTINSLLGDPSHDIQMVIVLGDLTSTGDTSTDFPNSRRILDSLHVPYVPLIGNHDIVPYWYDPPVPARDSDSLFTTRYFERWFGPVYESLKTGKYTQIRAFQRYDERPWNYEIDWHGSDTSAYTSGRTSLSKLGLR